MSKIVSVGELLVDKIGEPDSTLKDSSSFSKRAGGAPANVAVAASRLGADVEMIATVGKDEFGDFLVERLEDEGVKVKNIWRSEKKTTLAFVALDEENKPHFSFYRGADEHIHKGQLDLDLDSDDILHIGSLPFTRSETARDIIGALEEKEARVSFDPNLRGELLTEDYKTSLKEVIDHVDILTAAEDELEFFGGLDRLREKIDEILVTRGEKGADLYVGDGKHHFDAEEVDVVDTTGAGDALTGSYLASRSRGMDERSSLEKAVRAASISTTKKGAMEALPHREELE
ncbi:MAG: carbohydrate kinase family protein [Candidatus Nanohaloarchaea archaeon]